MTHEQLQHDRASLICDLDLARGTWLAEKAVSAFANFEPLDILLDELHDLDIAFTQEGITDYD